MQTRSNAIFLLELFLVFGLSVNPEFLLPPQNITYKLYLVSYTAIQRLRGLLTLRGVRHYAWIIEPQSRDLTTKLFSS